MGHVHFGETQLGRAPRFSDFKRMCRNAEERGINPREVNVE